MKEVWLIIGFFSLLLGVVGIVLPILPTTPFLILTAYGFSKGNTKIHNWFLKSKIARNFTMKMEMSKSKIIILNVFVDTLLITYIVVYNSSLITILLVIVIIVKHIVFFKFVKTI